MSTVGATLERQESRTRWTRAGLLAIALIYVGALLVAPLIGIIYATAKAGLSVVTDTFNLPDVRHAFWLSAVIAVLTVLVTTVLGVVASWVLARHRFRGRGLLNALVDLPMAVSPVIVGLMAVILFGRGGWFEPFFAAQGIQVIFALPSMIIVTIFICLPFVIREVVPVLEEIGVDEEEAAKTLGANSIQTFFKITLPNIKWGLAYGIALTTARSLGEIGAVLIVSGNLKGQTETVPIWILTALEERMEPAAYVVALTLATVSIVLLLAIELFKRRREREVKK